MNRKTKTSLRKKSKQVEGQAERLTHINPDLILDGAKRKRRRKQLRFFFKENKNCISLIFPYI